MSEFIIKEHMTIVNDSEKTAYAVQMLQQYIRNLRSPTVLHSIDIESMELLRNNKMVSLSGLSFNNLKAREDTAWIHNDDFFNPIMTQLDGEDELLCPTSILVAEEHEKPELISFRISYRCEIAIDANVGYRYWKDFFWAFDCDELRESVSYKSLIVRAGAEDNNYNLWFGRILDNSDQYVLYVYNSDQRGFVKPVECDYIPFSEEDWKLCDINFDDYNDIYTWLAVSEEEWSQKALDKWESAFKENGIEMERYCEYPNEDDGDDCKYIWQGINLFGDDIKGDNVNNFIGCYNSFIKYLRSLSNKEEKPDGNSFRYLIGEGRDCLSLIILDDSDPDYDGVKISCARI